MKAKPRISAGPQIDADMHMAYLLAFVQKLCCAMLTLEKIAEVCARVKQYAGVRSCKTAQDKVNNTEAQQICPSLHSSMISHAHRCHLMLRQGTCLPSGFPIVR